MFQLTQGVQIRLGFWKGCNGVIIDKIPFLPIYKALVEGKEKLHWSQGLLAELPTAHWFWWFQIKSDPNNADKRKLVDEQGMIDLCILHLVGQCSEVLNMSHFKVQRAMNVKVFSEPRSLEYREIEEQALKKNIPTPNIETEIKEKSGKEKEGGYK